MAEYVYFGQFLCCAPSSDCHEIQLVGIIGVIALIRVATYAGQFLRNFSTSRYPPKAFHMMIVAVL